MKFQVKNWILCILPFLTETMTAQDVMWKRAPVVEKNLIQALDLTVDTLCQEIDLLSCFETVHDFSLGNHDPIEKGQLEGLKDPSQSTAISLDRVVLLSCQKRLSQDHPLFLIKPNQNKASQYPEQQWIEQAQEYSRRFLGRQLNEIETGISRKFIQDNAARASAYDLQLMLCFIMGSHLETIFY